MKRYEVKITLKSGDEVNAKVTARNQADAMRRLQSTAEFVNFIADSHSEVDRVDIQPIAIEPIDHDRYALTTAVNKAGWYILADLDNRIRIEFKRGHYNETNRILPLSGERLPNLDAMQMATVLREAGEYLAANFSGIV